MGTTLNIILLLLGVAVITTGVWLIYIPAALIVGGCLMVALALYSPRNYAGHNNTKPPKGGA